MTEQLTFKRKQKFDWKKSTDQRKCKVHSNRVAGKNVPFWTFEQSNKTHWKHSVFVIKVKKIGY